jgi:predicted transcriptional regulator
MSTTLRVTEETRQRIATIANATGQRMHTVVEHAVDAYERELFWTKFHEGYERLAADPDAWADIEAERAAEAPSLGDGID